MDGRQPLLIWQSDAQLQPQVSFVSLTGISFRGIFDVFKGVTEKWQKKDF